MQIIHYLFFLTFAISRSAVQRQQVRASRHSSLTSGPAANQCGLMCKPHPAQLSQESQGVPEEPASPEMDSHLLLDALTLSAVAILLIILLVAKVAKKRKELTSTKTCATQTSVWDTDIEKALAKINEEMVVFHGRLEKVEQARLESITLRGLSENPETLSKESKVPASEAWTGSNPIYPPF